MDPDKIEQAAKAIRVKRDAIDHERIVGDAISALQQGAKEHRIRRLHKLPMIWKGKMARIAAAAVIIVAVGVAFVAHRRPAEQIAPPMTVTTARSPAKMMTRLSLNLAYRQGGMEAIELRCREASKLLAVKGRSVSIQELLNGDNNGS